MTLVLQKITLGAVLVAALGGTALPALARENIDVAMVLDNSGSMYRLRSGPGNDAGLMRLAAVQYLLEKMAPGDRAAVVTFDRGVNQDPRASRLQDIASIRSSSAFNQGIQAILHSPGDATNLSAALSAGASILQGDGASHRKRFLLLLTDGAPDPPGGPNSVDSLVNESAQIAGEGISIYTVGLGDLSFDSAANVDPRQLLERVASAGHGTYFRAAHAADLPPLFGSIFSQLAGHEVSRVVPTGGEQGLTLAAGSEHLEVIGTNDGAAPSFTLIGPDGRTYTGQAVAPLSAQQTARLAVVSVDHPASGTWKAASQVGSLEVSYEPDFGAVIDEPKDQELVPAEEPIPVVVEERRAGSGGPLDVPGERVEIEYEHAGGGEKPAPISLSEVSPGRFQGTVPASGAPGLYNLVARCFRSGILGEEEGVPAHEALHVLDLPVLAVLSPTPGAAFALPDSIPVQATVRVAGQRVSSIPPGIRVRAALLNAAGQSRGSAAELERGAGGVLTGRVPTVGAPGPVVLRLTLSGQFQGSAIPARSVDVPLTLSPMPAVRLSWSDADIHPADPDGSARLVAHVSSSAGSPQQIQLALDGLPGVVLDPPVLDVAPNQPETDRTITVRWRHLAPGSYRVRILPRLADAHMRLIVQSQELRLRVRTWLERNRWWLYPLIGLLILLALLITGLVALWTREQARRRRRMLSALNSVEVYIPGSAEAYTTPHQSTLQRREFTFGGNGADVLLPDPEHKDRPRLDGPRFKVGVDWDGRRRRPRLRITPVGETDFYDQKHGPLAEPDPPTQEGSFFYVEPGNCLVRVNSQLTG